MARSDNPYYVMNVQAGDTVYWQTDDQVNVPLVADKVLKRHIVCGEHRFYRETGEAVKRGLSISHITQEAV